MTRRIALTTCLLLAACRDGNPAVDPRGLALEGDWHLELHDASRPDAGATTGRVALVAVREEPGLLGQRNRRLAAGAVSLDSGELARRLADGSRAEARLAGGDSVELRLSSGRGTLVVTLVGVAGSDTMSGVWHTDLTRSAGRAGRFRLMRIQRHLGADPAATPAPGAQLE